MAEEKKNLQITGTQNRTYDLDEIEKQNRTNSDLELRVQVYEYHNGENPNPANPAVGQIWISKYVIADKTESSENIAVASASANELPKSSVKKSKSKKSSGDLGLNLVKIE